MTLSTVIGLQPGTAGIESSWEWVVPLMGARNNYHQRAALGSNRSITQVSERKQLYDHKMLKISIILEWIILQEEVGWGPLSM